MTAPLEQQSPPSGITGADRPLTVPLLVRGELNNSGLISLTLMASVFLGLGLLGALKTPPDPGLAGLGFVLAGLFGLPALGMFVWLLRRRSWLEVTLGGFVVTQRGGKMTFTDADVTSLARQSKLDNNGITHHRLRLLVLHAGKIEAIACAYKVFYNQTDPLAVIWDRLVRSLARRTRENLSRQGKLEGDNWQLDADGFHFQQQGRRRIALEEVSKVAEMSKDLCIWKGNEERPFLRLAKTGPNIYPLQTLLMHELSGWPNASKPIPDCPAGRILLEYRSFDWALVAGILVLELIVLGFLAPGSGQAAVTFWSIVYPLALFLGLLLSASWALWRRRTNWLIFREYGLTSHTSRGEQSLLYNEVGTLMWKPGPQLRFEPLPGLDRPVITFRRWLQLFVPGDLYHVQETICMVMALRWWWEASKGPVPWTPRLRFLPGGLEVRPSGLLGDGEPVTVPYLVTSFQVDHSHFRLYTPDSKKPICTERVVTPNFYPGFMLLRLLHSRLQQAQWSGDVPGHTPGWTRAEASEHVTGREGIAPGS